MAKIYSPNKKYNGVSASVKFNNGVGETDDPNLIGWFLEQGYEVTDEVMVDDQQVTATVQLTDEDTEGENVPQTNEPAKEFVEEKEAELKPKQKKK